MFTRRGVAQEWCEKIKENHALEIVDTPGPSASCGNHSISALPLHNVSKLKDSKRRWEYMTRERSHPSLSLLGTSAGSRF